MDVPASVPTTPVSRERKFSQSRAVFTFPWWLAILIFVGLCVAYLIWSSSLYSDIFTQLRAGISLTLKVSFISYTSALIIGLIVGLIRANPPHARFGSFGVLLSYIELIIYNLATLYVQVLRGMPILVTLLIVAFVIVPAVKDFMGQTFGIILETRGSYEQSAIIALAFTYGAFLSETFRAGIQSIGRGQIEAARSLGMNYFQVMRYVVLPQAVRRILPPLGNDMIAMIKDSSLVAYLGIRDITQLAKLSSSTSFRYLETYMIAAMIYLMMTIPGSMVVRFIERRFPVDR
jgi:polar amino acid transport system permease protein